MTALAQEFGISDRGLAKVCSRHRIPVPPRGYWAKVAAGEQPKVPPFLDLRDRSLDRVSIRGATSALPDSVAELARKRKTERQARAATIKATPQSPMPLMENPHALVATRNGNMRESDVFWFNRRRATPHRSFGRTLARRSRKSFWESAWWTTIECKFWP